MGDHQTQLAEAHTEAASHFMTHEEMIAAAKKLRPLLAEKAREAEAARQPLDEVIKAIGDAGIYSMLTPKCFGGHELDMDTFFEVILELSKADAAMGWLTAFYVEHAFWFCGFPEEFQKEVFKDDSYVLAPSSLSLMGGSATPAEGGYELSGRWQWGTGVLHASWVLVGALFTDDDGNVEPLFFAIPRDEVEAIDTWFVSGMCATGSYDIEVKDVFVPAERVTSMLTLTEGISASEHHDGPMYRTPLIPILGFASALAILGAAQGALESYQTKTKEKIAANIARAGGTIKDEGKPSVVAKAAMNLEAAELVLRDILKGVMEERAEASRETRLQWIARMSHAVFMCRTAVQDIASVTGAGGFYLDSPVQKALRDISTGSNHIIFDRESRYSDFGRVLLDQPIESLMI
ncbi:MAG: acyl-CoA dehydrogenase family protein [Pseudomonadota bacterium]